MNTTRPCGCKGYRTCLYCEKSFNIPTTEININNDGLETVVYCPFCNLCYPGQEADSYKSHPIHKGRPLRYEGIYIQLNFLTDLEHDELMKGIDSMPWDLSQSGRKKQNFGPKCNFKGRKMRLGAFRGFPRFSQFVQDKFEQVPILRNYQTIEQCSLDYDSERGSSIDPHVDDCWVWGERIITVSLLSDSVLTLSPNRNPKKYNLDLVQTYLKVVGNNIPLTINKEAFEHVQNAIVLVPMPKNSLLVMYGGARYNYEHRILREHIAKRRVCLTYREFTPTFLEGGSCYEEGKLITDKAQEFF